MNAETRMMALTPRMNGLDMEALHGTLDAVRNQPELAN